MARFGRSASARWARCGSARPTSTRSSIPWPRRNAGQVAEDAAARDVRERLCARPKPAHVVEVEARRREQVVAVVILVLEHAPDECEAVRVDAGRRDADDGVAFADAAAVNYGLAVD